MKTAFQIVIPSIFSGDNVTVLLDLVSDRPGAIADVSLRYKDLVFLRNGSLRGHLDLPGGHLSGAETARGPAELAVLKNLLSHHFVEAVKQAATALGRQQVTEAVIALSSMRATIDQARQELPAWAHDPDIIRDQQVLDRYLAVLASPQAGSHQAFLADSLALRSLGQDPPAAGGVETMNKHVNRPGIYPENDLRNCPQDYSKKRTRNLPMNSKTNALHFHFSFNQLMVFISSGHPVFWSGRPGQGH